MADRKFKEIKDSRILVKRVLKEWKGSDGQHYMQTSWEELSSPISLGSCAKPNKDILEIKFHVPDKQRKFFGFNVE